MSKKKTIAVAIVLALILLIGGMLAYFTDTETETNKFTLGKVDIEITEQWTPADGQNVVPGQEINKAPSIKNKDDSASAHVFAEVVIPCFTRTTTGENPTTTYEPLFTFTANSGWTLINTVAATSTSPEVKYVYAYDQKLAAGATTSSAVFSKVKVEHTLTQAEAETLTSTDIVINAKGVQSEGLPTGSTPAEIYALN